MEEKSLKHDGKSVNIEANLVFSFVQLKKRGECRSLAKPQEVGKCFVDFLARNQ